MITEIMRNSRQIEQTIFYLKKVARYYPELIYKKVRMFDENVDFVTTLVRKQSRGIWHVIHIVEMSVGDEKELIMALERLIKTVHKIQLIDKNNGEVDSLQISEEERLMKCLCK